jgi:hypothetical protein
MPVISDASTILDNIVTISEKKTINSMRQPEPKYLETSQNKHIYSKEQIKILKKMLTYKMISVQRMAVFEA